MQKPIRYFDGKIFSTLEEFYDHVSEVLIPGASWGRNLDAFNDILCAGFGGPEEGFDLVWRNSTLSKQRLGYEETVRQLEERAAKCCPSNLSAIEAAIAQAKRSEGPTVFDWLVEIIREHQNIELRFM